MNDFVQELNAAALYQHWYIGSQSIAGATVPCTDVRLFGPKVLLPEGDMSDLTSACGTEYTTESCERARRKVATWDVDFKWTKTQHEMGAQFATQHCRREKPGADPYARACEALKIAPIVENTAATNVDTMKNPWSDMSLTQPQPESAATTPAPAVPASN